MDILRLVKYGHVFISIGFLGQQNMTAFAIVKPEYFFIYLIWMSYSVLLRDAGPCS